MQKHVTVFEQDFYLGTYEVTQEQWPQSWDQIPLGSLEMLTVQMK